MRKILIIFALMGAMLVSLCACENEIQTEEPENFVIALQKMKIEILLSMEDFLGSNRDCIEADNKILEENWAGANLNLVASRKKIQEGRKRIEAYMVSPNFIIDCLDNIIGDHDEMIEISNYSDISEDDKNKIVRLAISAAEDQFLLFGFIQSIIDLNAVREFDCYTDEEAKENLQEFWWQFQLNMECPETIEKQEIFILWAEKHADKFTVTEAFLEELNSLRKDDDMTSREYNKRWADFVYKFVFSDKTEVALATSVLNSFSFN